MQAVENTVQMHTPKGEGLFNSFLNEGSGVVLVKLEDAYKFLYSSPFRPFLPQDTQHAVVGLRPPFAPALERLCIIKRPRTLLKQGKVVQRIENILLASIRARMPGKQCCFVKDIDVEGICLNHDIEPCSVDRHRVAVGLKSRLAVGC